MVETTRGAPDACAPQTEGLSRRAMRYRVQARRAAISKARYPGVQHAHQCAVAVHAAAAAGQALAHSDHESPILPPLGPGQTDISRNWYVRCAGLAPPGMHVSLLTCNGLEHFVMRWPHFVAVDMSDASRQCSRMCNALSSDEPISSRGKQLERLVL